MAHALLPANLPDRVRVRFNAAKEAGNLVFWPTQVAIVHPNRHGPPFQLRFAPSIANKPKSSTPGDGKKPADPFLDPPEALLLADLGSPLSHILVLNKFAIVPEHFILATKSFKEQTDLLEEDDLSAAYACLQSWRTHGRKLFAFFNSGEHSGASQPHRHIQFLPVDSMMNGVEQGQWHPLLDSLTSTAPLNLPFTHFVTSLPSSPTPSQLREIYLYLHDQACQAVKSYLLHHPGDELRIYSSKNGSAAISYNLGMTDSSMALIPRRAEGAPISIGGELHGSTSMVSLNGTILAGTLLVKNESEWNALKEDASQLLDVLKVIGIPSSSHIDEKL